MFADCYFSPTVQIVVLSLLMLEGLMFGLFTAIMCGSQLASICYDETVSTDVYRFQTDNVNHLFTFSGLVSDEIVCGYSTPIACSTPATS